MNSWKVGAVLAAFSFACGGGGGGTPPADAVGAGSTFSGTLSDGALLEISLSTPAGLRSEAAVSTTWPLDITGTITPAGGSPIAVTGGFDPDGKTFMISGGGYSITGTYASSTLTATGSAPDNSSVTLIAYRSDDSVVTVYCGTWEDTAGGTDQGTFNMVVRGTAISGVADNGNTFVGSVSGTSFTVHDSEGTVASGTISGAGSARTIAGTIRFDGSSVGSFSGSVCH